MYKLIIYCLILIAFQSPVLNAQRSFDKDEFEQITEGRDYSESTKQVTQSNNRNNNSSPFRINNDTLKVIAYILVATLLIFIIYILVRNLLKEGRSRVRKIKDPTLQDLDERPMETDLESYLLQAIAENDYRLAFRIRYLILIRTLHEMELIQWRKEKTNHDYLTEMSAHSAYRDFKGRTILFDRLWYGLQPISQEAYKLEETYFNNLQKELNKS